MRAASTDRAHRAVSLIGSRDSRLPHRDKNAYRGAYQKLIVRRAAFIGRMNALRETIDVLAMPVLSFPTPSLERMTTIDDALIAGLHQFTCPFNLSGHPGIVLPCGVTDDATPIVFQRCGRHFDEDLLVCAGHAFQLATTWHLRHPAL